MIIENARIEVSDAARLVFPIASEGNWPEELWFSVATEFAPLLSERVDAALVGLVVAAMRAGEDIQVTGHVTDTLLAEVAGEVQDLQRRLSPDWPRITVTASDAQPAAPRAGGIGLAFSGGVDSFASLEVCVLHAPFPSMRATHLINTNVGSHDPVGRPLFRERLVRLAPISDRLGIPLVAVDSNLSDFYWPGSWEASHVTRNIAGAMILQQGLGRLLHSSSYDWSQLRVIPGPIQSRVEPIMDPMLSTDAFTVTLVLGGMGRLDKTRMIAHEPLAYEFLDPCTDLSGTRNCSSCPKCSMTMLSLQILGVLDRYSGIFDIERYRRGLDDYLGYAAQSDSALQRELLEAAKAVGIEPPKQSLAGVSISRMSRLLHRPPRA